LKIKLGRWLVLSGLMVLAGFLTASCSSDPPPEEAGTLSQPENRGTGEVPLVTLGHWKDSTPGERYAFLIGFVTMLELEKEWQGHGGRELAPFSQSLVQSWVMGFADRPLTEIYNGINSFLSTHPGDTSRPVAEVMWFVFVQPRLDENTSTQPQRPETPPEPDAGQTAPEPVS